MHARIDVLMRPCPQSLLPSSVFIYWGYYYCEHLLHVCINTLEHTDTSREHYLDYSTCHLHRTVLLSVGAHEHCSIHRRSTSLEAYCHLGDTSSSRVVHITIFGIPGWAPTDCEWPELMESIPPWLKPKSASVLPDRRKRVTRFRIRRVSRLD